METASTAMIATATVSSAATARNLADWTAE
jgi:hypothetical protein